MNRLTDLEHKLTGPLTTLIRVAPTATPGPRMPSWWRGDEDASASTMFAMSQLQR